MTLDSSDRTPATPTKERCGARREAFRLPQPRGRLWVAAVFVASLGWAIAGTGSLAGQVNDPAYVLRDHYRKREVMIPMRDGVRLYAAIYEPLDTSRRYPILIARDAYGARPYGPDAYRPWAGAYTDFSKEGFIFVYEDVRGRWMSEGTFVHHEPYVENGLRPNSTTDMHDTVEWLLANVANHNGRVGQRGVSWPGWEVAMGMIDAHPAIRASSPQAPPQDQFLGDDYHSGGAFQLAYGFAWMSQNARARTGPTPSDTSTFDYGTPDGYRFFLELGAAANAKRYFGDAVPTYDEFMRHGTYDDYWRARNVPQHLAGVTHPVLIVGGWFDAEDFAGPFHLLRGLDRLSPGHQAHLVVGPWDHGGWGRNVGDTFAGIPFGSATGDFFRQQVELPFFRAHLGDQGTLDLPKALMFETGGNRWRRCDTWPPVSTPRTLYLHGNGAASFDREQAAAFDEYVSDPAKPVPYTAEIIATEGRRWTVEDQRFVASRPDVLAYETTPLTDDLTIAGPTPAELFVSTTGTDGDWVVKLIDEYPDDAPDPVPNPLGLRMGGYQMLVVGDIKRAKFRRDYSRPEPMVPGRVTRVPVELGDRYHTFRKGHRVMVQIQSSWFPMFDRNPQTFVDIYHAQPSDYRRATHRVHRGGTSSSALALPVVAGGGCPVQDGALSR
ncbi:MAG: CocE/NonD family hydrolase [Vicinamibacterales bacterium]